MPVHRAVIAEEEIPSGDNSSFATLNVNGENRLY